MFCAYIRNVCFGLGWVICLCSVGLGVVWVLVASCWCVLLVWAGGDTSDWFEERFVGEAGCVDLLGVKVVAGCVVCVGVGKVLGDVSVVRGTVVGFIIRCLPSSEGVSPSE